ncbi:MAG: AEC family transporter [Eubacteriales bacterium]|nr:AEC family transporter [Eubacteriales bacterium]
MLSIFSYAFNAIAPILLLVLLGYLLRVKQVFSPQFFKLANRFAFHYSFPALMFVNLYTLDSIWEIDVRLAVYLLISLMIITLVSIILANLLTNARNQKGVLIQAGFRSNFAIIGLPLVEGLVGSAGRAAAAAMQAPTVIYFNVVSVLALTIYSDDAAFSPRKILKNLVRNPLIQGLSAGVIVLVIREFIPVAADGTLVFSISGTLPWLYTTLQYLARLGTPLCLIMLGGQFNFSDVHGIRKQLTAAVLMRLILAPILGFSMAFAASHFGLLELGPATIGIMIAAYGSPVAVSSAVMASEMHADDVLAGQIVVWNSLLSMFTIFFLAVLFRSVGML